MKVALDLALEMLFCLDLFVENAKGNIFEICDCWKLFVEKNVLCDDLDQVIIEIVHVILFIIDLKRNSIREGSLIFVA